MRDRDDKLGDGAGFVKRATIAPDGTATIHPAVKPITPEEIAEARRRFARDGFTARLLDAYEESRRACSLKEELYVQTELRQQATRQRAEIAEHNLALAEAVVEALRPMLHWEAIACRTYPASACSRYGGCPQCRLRDAVAAYDAGRRK